jgi:transposase InsO family protein
MNSDLISSKRRSLEDLGRRRFRLTHNQLVDGRRFRALTVVDIYTRESLAIEARQSMNGEDVVMVLNRILLQCGPPKVLFNPQI